MRSLRGRARVIRGGAAFGAAVALAIAAVAGSAPEADAQRRTDRGERAPFSHAEQERLARGGLVTRPTARARGQLRLVGGTSWQVVRQPPEVVWRAALDTPRYPQMLPRVSEARVIASDPRARTVYVRHAGGGVDARYYLKTRVSHAGKSLRFGLDDRRPHTIRAAYGFLTVRAWRPGQSLITYGVMADVGTGVLIGLLRPTIQTWILRVPWTMKRFIETSGWRRYRSS